jgi:hypothetical protein
MMTENSSPERIRAAEQAVEKYHDQLNRAKFEMETQRDRTLVLITGGALTVSFAYIPTMLDKGPVLALAWLIAAWVLWVATLVLTLTNYTLSVQMYSAVLNALSNGDYSRVSEGHWAQKVVEPVNIASIVLMVLGFCAFGRFAILNLERVSHVEEKGQEVSSQAPREFHSRAPAPATGVPAVAGEKEGHAQEKKVNQ